MPRTMTDLAKDAATQPRVRTAHLVRAVFANSETGHDEEYFVTDNFRDVTVDGQVYSALGSLLSLDGIEESTDMQIATVKLVLSGVDRNLISAVLQYQYIDRALEVYRVFFTLPESVVDQWDDGMSWDDTANLAGRTDLLIDAPVKIFDGMMDRPIIADDPEGGTVTVALTASSHFADFERKPGRHTNHEEQQAHFPGDAFFSFVGNFDSDIIWGKSE